MSLESNNLSNIGLGLDENETTSSTQNLDTNQEPLGQNEYEHVADEGDLQGQGSLSIEAERNNNEERICSDSSEQQGNCFVSAKDVPLFAMDQAASVPDMKIICQAWVREI